MEEVLEAVEEEKVEEEEPKEPCSRCEKDTVVSKVKDYIAPLGDRKWKRERLCEKCFEEQSNTPNRAWRRAWMKKAKKLVKPKQKKRKRKKHVL